MRPSGLALLAALTMLSPRTHAAPAAPADGTALRDVVTSYEQAIRSGDVSKSGIRKNLASGFTAVLPSGQLIASYGELSKAENALRTMVGRGARYEPPDVLVDPSMEVSGDLAAFTGRTLNKATAQAGKSLAFTTHWSAVARKEDGGWRLLRHQAVMDPATNPWQPAGSSGPGWSAVLVAGLLGALAGAVIGVAAARILGGRSVAASAHPAAGPAPTGTPAPKARAWDKSYADTTPSTDPLPSASQGRSWRATPAPEPAPPQPADPDADPPAPDPAESAAPPAPRSGKKRAWEN